MKNPFTQRATNLSNPTSDIVPVTPSDSVNLVAIAHALYVETGGYICFITAAGQTRTVRVTDHAVLPVGAQRVKATGTTATGIHALVNG